MEKLKIVYLLPPSEGKKGGGNLLAEKLSFSFEKPLDIAKNATKKDLKCTGNRFEEGKSLNENISHGPFMQALERYNGVMYQALDYTSLPAKAQKYFQEHCIIFSGMYGLIKPCDVIANYKLPIETKGLASFWSKKITEALNSMEVDIIVDLLPGSYKKMIDKTLLQKKLVEVHFVTFEEGKKKKLAHGGKIIKGKYIKKICQDPNHTEFSRNSTIEIVL